MVAVEGAPPAISLQLLLFSSPSMLIGIQPAVVAGPPTNVRVLLAPTARRLPQHRPVETPIPKPVSFEPSHLAMRLNHWVPALPNRPPTSAWFVEGMGVSARISLSKPGPSAD